MRKLTPKQVERWFMTTTPLGRKFRRRQIEKLVGGPVNSTPLHLYQESKPATRVSRSANGLIVEEV